MIKGHCIKAVGGLTSMRLSLLHSINAHLDVMLGPPYPKTQADKKIWIPDYDANISFPAPILPKWIPPVWVPPSGDGGFWLAQQVICYQRGYHSKELFHQYMEAVAVCFECSVQESIYGIDRIAYDFFVAVVSHDHQVTTACVVEFRPSTSPNNAPYLYISTLCTNPKYASKGLAHQLVRAVYTLGMIMIEQNTTAPGIWRNAIPDKHLFIGLTVAKTPNSNVADRLEHLYTQCGLRSRPDKPRIAYESFTPYSIYEWQMENECTKFPMWQSIRQNVLYEDHQVSILHPSCKDGSSMYHAFPTQQLSAVRSNGIVHPKHTFLHEDISNIYTPDRIEFQKQAPTREGMFRIQIQSELEVFELRISVPVWFATEIRRVSGLVH